MLKDAFLRGVRKSLVETIAKKWVMPGRGRPEKLDKIRGYKKNGLGSS